MLTFPNAKINLGLNIVSVRPDGYHDLQTVMVPVGWHDILEIVPSANVESTLTITGNPCNCPQEKNLVMKAYRLIASHYNVPQVDIYLHKNIPDGAGLGGGSSDAAFALKMLNSLFELGLSDDCLCQLAGRLGADCPFFIRNSLSYATGIGTDLEYFNCDNVKGTLVLVKPEASVTTAEAYSRVKIDATATPPLDILMGSQIDDWAKNGLKNDFETSVFEFLPELKAIKTKLTEYGASYAAMSGSGSTVFGIYNDERKAAEAAEQFASLTTHVCHLRPSERYL